MSLSLVLKVHNIIIHNLCKYTKYINLRMYKFRTLFLFPYCTHLVAHYLHTQLYGPKIMQYQICSCKR
jgi:hypothetical protein